MYDYACPTDVKGNRIIDIRPQANRSAGDRAMNSFSADFDRIKADVRAGALVEARWNGGVKTLRLAIPANGNVLIDDMNSIGSWANGGGASAPVLDNVTFAQGSASLKYDLVGSGYLENQSEDADLSDMENEGVLFCYVWSPAVKPTSHTLLFGSDASNYWSVTVTAAWDGTAYAEGWNLLGFDWATATKTGSPDASKLSYFRLSTVQVGTASPVRLDWLMASPGKILEIEYYSKFLFRDASTSAFKERATADSDLINLDTDSYMMFFNKVMRLAVQQLQGSDGASDAKTFSDEYEKGLKAYQAKYPSQAQKTQTAYYRVKKRNTSNFVGRRLLRP